VPVGEDAGEGYEGALASYRPDLCGKAAEAGGPCQGRPRSAQLVPAPRHGGLRRGPRPGGLMTWDRRKGSRPGGLGSSRKK
jgi:hypothetical protein